MTICYLILGLVGAWFVNYLSDVLPRYRKFASPTCPDCQSGLTWRYYIFFEHCRECGQRPSKRHWIILVSLPILAVLLRYYPPPVMGQEGGLIWLIYFAVIFVIDMEHRLILHPMSLVGAILGMAFGIKAHGLVETLLGGTAGFGIMLIFYFLGELFIRFLAKRRGEEIQEIALGFGDVNLSGVIGTILGWPGIVGGIFLAVLLGGIVSGAFLLIQLVRKEYQAYQALPYGPFLVVSVYLLLYISQIA